MNTEFRVISTVIVLRRFHDSRCSDQRLSDSCCSNGKVMFMRMFYGNLRHPQFSMTSFPVYDTPASEVHVESVFLNGIHRKKLLAPTVCEKP
jgi:hypothetical protein